MFVPGLYLISPAYRSGYSYATHLAVLTLAPPIAVFIMRGLRYLLLKYYPRSVCMPGDVAGGLTLYCRKRAWLTKSQMCCSTNC